MINVQILRLIEGAKNATGLTVIIDVFRAISLECYLYDMGAKDWSVWEIWGCSLLQKMNCVQNILRASWKEEN